MVSLEVVAILLSGIGISASLVYYASVLRNTNKTREAQLFMQSYKETSTPELQERAYELLSWEWQDFEDFNTKYWSDKEARSKFIAFMVYMNGLGIMLEEGHLPARLLYKMDQGGYIPIMVWYKFRTIVQSQRAFLNNPENFKYLEYYAEEMIKLRTQNGLAAEWSNEQSKLIYE